MPRVPGQDGSYWINEFRNGSAQAFTWFFDRHNKSLCYFATRLVQDQKQGEEIVSDCFLKLWQKRADFQTPANVKAFLYISCRNACLNYLEKLQTQHASQEQYILHLRESEQDILNEVVQAEVLDLVNREIENLPEKMRQVFKMLYLERKSTTEISEQLGTSVQTIRNQKTRAIEIIKNTLLKKGVPLTIYLAFLFFIEKK